MASLHHDTGGASALPLHLIAQAIPRLSRHDLAALAERLIERLDQQDGDPDLEDDDPSGQRDEDGVNTGNGALWEHGKNFAGPGCMISDEDCNQSII